MSIVYMFLGLALLLLYFFSYSKFCLSFVFLFIIVIVIFRSIFQFSIVDKRCFASCYLNPRSFLYKLFMGRVFIFLMSLFKSFALSAVLIYYVISFNTLDIVFFIFDTFILYYLNFFLFNKIGFFKENIQPYILNNMVSSISAFIMSIFVLFVSLYQHPPSYLQSGFWDTVKTYFDNFNYSCEYVSYLLPLKSIEPVKWWLLIQFTSYFKDFIYVKEAVWFMFLLGNYFAFFSYGKFSLEFARILERR